MSLRIPIVQYITSACIPSVVSLRRIEGVDTSGARISNTSRCLVNDGLTMRRWSATTRDVCTSGQLQAGSKQWAHGQIGWQRSTSTLEATWRQGAASDRAVLHRYRPLRTFGSPKRIRLHVPPSTCSCARPWQSMSSRPLPSIRTRCAQKPRLDCAAGQANWTRICGSP